MLHHRYAPLERWEPPAGEFERTDFIGIQVPDRPTGAAFYSDTLGLKRNGLSSDEWPEFEPGNATILLNTPEQTGDTFKVGNYSISLRVADVAETMDRLQGAGVEFEFPQVYDSSVCHMAFFKDPDGNSLILHRRYAPYSDGSTP
jgi:catechol 2,3-dioxygenase-like lactoylglutathione lyase family enzyme